MDGREFSSAQRALPEQMRVVNSLRAGGGDRFYLELSKLLELTITVYGHAWCMDVKTERRSLARLMTKTVKEVL